MAKVNQFIKSEGYYGNIRTDIIDLILNKPNKILEIVGGKGYTLKKLKELGKANYIAGIEIDIKVADEARGYLDYVVCEDIEQISSLPFEKNFFDFIIFADVLEHLINPVKVIGMFRDYLTNKGSIIATIPNLRHKSVIMPLVFKGQFKYDPEGGSLDISHLRFYTRESIISLFKVAGYPKIEFYDYPLSFKAKLASFFTFGFLKDFFVYKFRVVARK